MKAYRLFVFSLPLIISGCAQVPQVSSSEAAGLIVEALKFTPGPAQQELLEWSQPDNKKEPCLVAIPPDSKSRRPEDSVKLLWDGECRDGYAFGLGRWFNQGPKGLSSALVRYQGGKVEPELYAYSDYSKRNHNLGDAKARFGFEVKSRNPYDVNMFIYSHKDNGVLYLFNSDLAGNKVTAKVLPHGYGIKYSEYSDPASKVASEASIVFNGGPVKYIAVKYRDGTSYDYDVRSNPKIVTLPENYHGFLRSTFSEIQSEIEKVKAKESVVNKVIDQYKSRVCKGEVKFDGVDSEIYGQVCLPEGELEPHLKGMEEAVAKHQKRYQETQRQQIVSAQQVAYQNQLIQQQSINQINGQLQDFANNMNAFSNNMFNMNMQNLNTPQQGAQFGIPQNEHSYNCYQVSNIVSCRPR